MVEIGEPIDAVVKFENGKVKPAKIRWRGQVQKIKEVTGWWRSEKGKTKFFHLSLITESGDYYEIALNTKSLVWYLEKLEPAG